MSAAVPGSLFVLAIDHAEEATRGEWLTSFVQVYSGERRIVAVFGDEPTARDWMALNVTENVVVRPHEFATRPEVIGFLQELIANGARDVCFEPTATTGRAISIRTLLRLIG